MWRSVSFSAFEDRSRYLKIISSGSPCIRIFLVGFHCRFHAAANPFSAFPAETSLPSNRSARSGGSGRAMNGRDFCIKDGPVVQDAAANGVNASFGINPTSRSHVPSSVGEIGTTDHFSSRRWQSAIPFVIRNTHCGIWKRVKWWELQISNLRKSNRSNPFSGISLLLYAWYNRIRIY